MIKEENARVELKLDVGSFKCATMVVLRVILGYRCFRGEWKWWTTSKWCLESVWMIGFHRKCKGLKIQRNGLWASKKMKECLGCEFVSWTANDLSIYRKKVWHLEVTRILRWQVMVLKLGFEITCKVMVPRQCRVVDRLIDVASDHSCWMWSE